MTYFPFLLSPNWYRLDQVQNPLRKQTQKQVSEPPQSRDGSRFSNIRIFYLILEYRLGCAIIF